MKLLSLNIWGGQIFEPLTEFFQKHSEEVDIFCLQEVLFGKDPNFLPETKARMNVFDEISSKLIDFVPYFYYSPTDFFQFEKLNGIRMGQSFFIRKPLNVLENGGFKTYSNEVSNMDFGGKATGNCQWVEIESNSKNVTVANVHGIWQSETGKKDTPERIEQSRIISDFLAQKSGKKILCGDFNLLPDTKSLSILEKDMTNLIKTYNVATTRSPLYTKSEKFADYTLVSPEILVKDFRVLQDVVSDHLPMLLEFS